MSLASRRGYYHKNTLRPHTTLIPHRSLRHVTVLFVVPEFLHQHRGEKSDAGVEQTTFVHLQGYSTLFWY